VSQKHATYAGTGIMLPILDFWCRRMTQGHKAQMHHGPAVGQTGLQHQGLDSILFLMAASRPA